MVRHNGCIAEEKNRTEEEEQRKVFQVKGSPHSTGEEEQGKVFEVKRSPHSTGEESPQSDSSESTVLYNMGRPCHSTKKNYDVDESTSPKKTKEEETEERRHRGEKEKEEKDDEDKELEKLLRMTNLKPSTGADSSNAEEERRKRKDKERKKPQKDELSLLDCLDTDTENDSSNFETEAQDKTEVDFSLIANSEIKKTFLMTSEESCQSSENEEAPKTEEKSKKKKSAVKQEPKERKKDDLSEFRIPNLDSEEASDKETKEKSEKENSLKNKESEDSNDSDESVLYLEYVKKRKPHSGVNRSPSCHSDSGSDLEQVYCKTESSPTKGRKNIKKILKKEKLQVETKQALKMENERKKRVKERQKQFNELFPEEASNSNLILDFDPETKEELLVVDEKLTQQLKPHQRDGVRFMWNCCFETLKRLEEDSGSGCVLAHCMGLGKTLQVVTLVHTLLTHNTGVHTVMILCPLSTIKNWKHEFKIWQKGCSKVIKPIDFRRKNGISRVKTWSQEGGVLIIGYEMFRSLIQKDSKTLVFSKGLLDPGPDLVVCDEGHVLKNSNSALSKSISRIKTLRRIILTGTPLQNNLIEYYCMVQFVKPNILGTKKEFNNRFVNPITNGQFEDSTEWDVCLMKRRSHVLHTMLDGFIQRFGYYVLTPFLPEKQEYVISINLTETQGNLYRLSIDQCKQESQGLLKDFHTLQKVWTHPRALLLHSKKNAETPTDWWVDKIPKDTFEDFKGSGKVFLLFDILRRSKQVGDKVLVFSQSLCSLDLIEFFLDKANRIHSSGVQSEFSDSWVFGQDYSRLDGSTNPENRDMYCQRFNNIMDTRFRLFLVSTRAGGLGINLVAANRVIMFDASWNPTHDVQSIFRVYRFGQNKPCFIYRFLAAATMEEKIYRRQVTKLSLAHRILDEHQIERHYTMGNLQELYTYNPIPKDQWKSPKLPKDKLFAEVLANARDLIVGYHEHDSLLENKEEEELTEEERRAAWEDFEKEKLTPEFPVNGNPREMTERQFPVSRNFSLNNITNEGLNAIHRYKQGIPRFQNAEANENDDRMCKIVDVRTLQDGGNNFQEMDTSKLLEYGRSLGLTPYNEENLERYCRRVEQELKRISPWGTPKAMVRGVFSNSSGSTFVP